MVLCPRPGSGAQGIGTSPTCRFRFVAAQAIGAWLENQDHLPRSKKEAEEAADGVDVLGFDYDLFVTATPPPRGVKKKIGNLEGA